MRLLRIFLMLAALMLPLRLARAFCCLNSTSHTLHVRATGNNGSLVVLGQDISPGQNLCNNILGEAAPVFVTITSLDADAIDYQDETFSTGRGSVTIMEIDRTTMGVPNNIYLKSYNQGGTLLEATGRGVGATARNVHFLASGCPQYSGVASTDSNRLAADAVHLRMRNDTIAAGSTIRGILEPGDLTQFDADEEWNWYMDSWADDFRYIFHGYGNHDISGTHPVNDEALRKHIRNTKRATVKTDVDPAPNHSCYSWDWHDVHFVQLNLYPADIPNANYTYLDPRGALTFLINDLAVNVGDSGRPVILTHHYGFECFSTGDCSNTNCEYWWTDQERLNYWNAIADYNVVALMVSHRHLAAADDIQSENIDSINTACASPPPPSGSHPNFERPAGATHGPSCIPAFIAASAMNGFYLEATLDDADVLTVLKKSTNGSIYFAYTNLIGRTVIPVVATSSGTDGNPYNSAAAAQAAVARINTAATNVIHYNLTTLNPCMSCVDQNQTNMIRTLRFEGGNYPGPVVLNQPRMRLTARNGVARIGGP